MQIFNTYLFFWKFSLEAYLIKINTLKYIQNVKSKYFMVTVKSQTIFDFT